MSGGDVLAVTLDLDGLDAETAEDACFAAGALAITYTDTRDDPILEPAPGEFRLWPAPRLQATFAGDTDPDRLAAALCAALDIERRRLTLELLTDRPWEREWLKDFQPMQFGGRLWVCPTHAEVTQPGAVVVRLDPGLAFGTGTHPTTALCLEWLDSHAPVGLQAIDYGCGSGILALAALKLGASRVWCHDIDPQALTATLDNARGNDLETGIECVAEASQLPRSVELVLANILSGPLCELAPALMAHLRPGGCIVLAGLLAEQADEVTAAYAPWCDLRVFGSRDGWVCLAGERRR